MEIVKRSSANFTRIFDILNYQREKYPNKAAINSFVDASWKAHSIDQIKSRAEAVACMKRALEEVERIRDNAPVYQTDIPIMR